MAENKRAHTPSEVDRQVVKATPQTHEKSFGGMMGSVDDALNNRPGVALPEPTNQAPRESSGDGFKKMMSGQGSTRRDVTTPATPPPPTKRATGTP